MARNFIPAILVLTLLTTSTSFCNLPTGGEEKIGWTTNFEQAVAQGQESQTPILLFFTGSDWCGWCNKLEEEALNTPGFYEEAGRKFLFVKLDTPLYSQLDPKIAAQNKQLQRKYGVRSYPTVVLLDSNQQTIGITGYRPGGGKDYAAHILKILEDYRSYKNQMESLENTKLSGTELKNLYEQARELENQSDIHNIVKKGMQSDEGCFFLKERYRILAEEGKIHNKEAIQLKHQILSGDPSNIQHTHYDLAVIDFEAYCDEMEKEDYSPDLAVEPLINYINRFGSKDKENVWRLQMIISQVYLEKNELGKALKYAKACHQSAPLCIQSEVSMAIKSIQTQMYTHRE